MRLRRRNLVSPSCSRQEGGPQGAPTVRRVREDGASECPLVIDGIGVALVEEQDLMRKQADFRLVFHHENT